MREYVYSLIVLLSFGVCFADVPPPVVPSQVKGSVGDWIEVKAEAIGQVRWHSPDKGLKLFPVHLLKDSKTAIVTAPKAGTYKLLCWTAKGDEPSPAAEVVTVIIDDSDPPPPDPTPPTPPTPDAGFYGDLKRLYDADKTEVATKREWLAKLAGFYKALLSYIDKPDSITVGDFRSDWQTAMAEVLGDIPADVLSDCRRLIAQRIGAALGTDPEAKLDPTIRSKAKAALSEITQALERLFNLEKRKK
jgi:hypothetical protein